MHLSWLSAVLLPAVPTLASAIPSVPSLKARTAIPLTRRSNHATNNLGIVNTTRLTAQIKKTQRKIAHGFEAYLRNTGEPHPAQSKTIQPRDETGSDPLTDADHETLWFGNIEVGTPQHLFTVDFDTGSSDLFLPGPKCGAGCSGHQIYNPDDSSTSKDQHQTAVLKFGDGSTVECEVFIDAVTVAGLTVGNQTLGAATNSSGFEIDISRPDGLMGLAFPLISVFHTQPFFQSLITQNVNVTPEFGVRLADSGSELFLGGVNEDQFIGNFTDVLVTLPAFWQIQANSVNVNGTPAISNLDVIIDTGTTLIIAPPKDVEQFYQSIPGAVNASATVGDGFFSFPCDSELSVSITFGGKQFPIPPDSFNLGPISTNSSQCVGAIAGSDTGGNFWVIGDTFLSNVYTKFDVGNRLVGFAELAHPGLF